MKTRSRITFALATLALLLSPMLARAQEPLELFPSGSAVVIRIGSVDQFVGNFDDMMAAISPVAQAATGEFRGGIAEMLGLDSAEDLATLDTSAPVFVCALPEDTREPFAAVVKVKDMPAFRRALLDVDESAAVETNEREDGFTAVMSGEETVYLREVGDMVLFSKEETVVDSLASAKTKNFASVLSGAARAEFMEGDAAAAINAGYLTLSFKSEIESARDDVMEGIDSLPDEQLEAGGASAEEVKQIYKDMAAVGFTLVFDAETLVGNISFAADGARAGGLLTVKENSATDRFAVANPARELETLGLLPEDAAVYYAVALGEETFGEMLGKYMEMQLATSGGDSDSMKEGIALLQGAGLQSMVGSFALPPDDRTGLLSRSITMARDPAAMRKASGEMLNAYSGISTPLMSIEMSYEADAETYKDTKIDLVKQTIQVDPNSAEGAILAPLFDSMFGGSVLESRIAVQENLVISSSGNGPQPMRTLLDGIESGEGVLGVTDAFGAARDQLSPKANLVFMLDLPRLIVDGVQMIENVSPFDMLLGGAGGMFNFRFDPPASYAAGSMSTDEHALRFRGFLSVEQPKNMFSIFSPGIF